MPVPEHCLYREKNKYKYYGDESFVDESRNFESCFNLIKEMVCVVGYTLKNMFTLYRLQMTIRYFNIKCS
jgi:hypothetical protein